MKSVLISIQPRWCELIASGKKLVEVRKSRPKIEMPFKCYIYCTQGDRFVEPSDAKWQDMRKTKKIIGEFVCDSIEYWTESNMLTLNPETGRSYLSELACVPLADLLKYLGARDCIYGWHISELKIYDKPRELREFRKPCNHINDCCTCKSADFQYYEDGEPRGLACKMETPLTRPFQSWGYAEEIK